MTPDSTRLTGSFSFVDSAICSDPVRVEGSYDEVMHTFYDQTGDPVRLAFTGKVSITYTNLSTGASYSPNSSGPATVDLQTGQAVLRGGNGALFGSNGVLMATDGHVVLDAAGKPISLNGQTVDICAQLGSVPL